jgi:hypothetical protein
LFPYCLTVCKYSTFFRSLKHEKENFTFISVFSLIACKREQKISSSDWTNISNRTQYKEQDGNGA